MDLKQVPGLGPSKIAKLESAGITTVRQLAGLDLRKNIDVPGVGRDALRNHKADARKLLAAEGKNVPKAPYSSKGKASGKRAKPKRATATHAKAPVQEVSEVPDLEKKWQEGQERVPAQVLKRGLFRRLLRRA